MDTGRIELWGGIECTVCRIGDTYYDQIQRSGHEWRGDDLDRIASLGITHLRYPVLWERVAMHGVSSARWGWTDERLHRLRALGITPIVTLLHHGSGPSYTDLLDEDFPEKFAAFAGAVSRRYPWLRYFTPINEPLTTARFSALYGWWYPHARSEASFYRALFNQLRGIRLAMEAIRANIPSAVLVATEDLGKTYSTPALAYQAAHENARRFLSYDLLCGRLDANPRMRTHVEALGFPSKTLERECYSPPGVLGYNYYVTGERWLDDRLFLYPSQCWGGNGFDRYADVEAVRACVESIAGAGVLIAECWERYRRTMAITEAHIACTREEQVRWLRDIFSDMLQVRRRGVDVRAVTAWSLLGAFDWNSALTRQDGYYESGAFDVSFVVPKETAVAAYVRHLAGHEQFQFDACDGPGWWRLPSRLQFEASSRGRTHEPPPASTRSKRRPLAILGDTPLAEQLRNACRIRNLETCSAPAENAWATVDCAGEARGLSNGSDPLDQAHALLNQLIDRAATSVRPE